MGILWKLLKFVFAMKHTAVYGPPQAEFFSEIRAADWMLETTEIEPMKNLSPTSAVRFENH